VSTTSIDCNQNYSSSDSADKDDHDKNVAVAVGAAALIGAIALAHKSHHHDDNKHYDNVDHEADFERGHRDALYGHSFDNYNNSSEYAQGYSSGVEQRNHDTSYRGNSHSYSNYHQNNNYQRHSSYSQEGVATNDLVGARGSSADDQMRSRGFSHVGNLTSGNTKYTIWYNSNTHQCMQMAMANGRVDSLVDIHSHPNCH
jgi:hypothetical protein